MVDYLRTAVAALAVAGMGIVAIPQQAATLTATRLYVDHDAPTCSNSGPGSKAAPYCTIQAAADAARAGDTVVIAGSNAGYFFNGGYNPYDENATIVHSGTRSAPITFE